MIQKDRRGSWFSSRHSTPWAGRRAVGIAAPVSSVKSFAAAVHNTDEMEHVIEQFARKSDSALLVLPDLFTATNRQLIIALAARHRLPAVYPARYFVASGGLMSY